MKVYHKSSKDKVPKKKTINEPTGLTGKFKTVELDKNKDAEKQEPIEEKPKLDMNLMEKPVNPLIKHFKRRFEMQKCSSANNILKASFKNRISLSPIENSLKHQQKVARNEIQINPFQLDCVTPEINVNSMSNAKVENSENNHILAGLGNAKN